MFYFFLLFLCRSDLGENLRGTAFKGVLHWNPAKPQTHTPTELTWGWGGHKWQCSTSSIIISIIFPLWKPPQQTLTLTVVHTTTAYLSCVFFFGCSLVCFCPHFGCSCHLLATVSMLIQVKELFFWHSKCSCVCVYKSSVTSVTVLSKQDIHT